MKKKSIFNSGGCGSPLIPPRKDDRSGSISFSVGRGSPLLLKLLQEAEEPTSAALHRFKFGLKDIVNNEIYINKNSVKKKKPRIEEEYKIDVSSYPPSKHQLKLRAMQKELDHLNAYNEREMWRIKRLRRKRKPKKVVVRKMVGLNGELFIQNQVKEEKKAKPKKAPL